MRYRDGRTDRQSPTKTMNNNVRYLAINYMKKKDLYRRKTLTIDNASFYELIDFRCVLRIFCCLPHQRFLIVIEDVLNNINYQNNVDFSRGYSLGPSHSIYRHCFNPVLRIRFPDPDPGL